MKRVITGFVIASFLSLLPSIVDFRDAWVFKMMCENLEIFTWLIILFMYIPYKNLFAKSLILILAVNECMDPIAFFTWPLFKNPYYIYILKFAISATLLFHIWHKNYERDNDELDDAHFFRVGIRPKGAQDFIQSLIGDPVGGVGIYARGQYFHYRHGELKVHSRKYLERSKKLYRIKKMRRIDEKRLAVLKKLPSSKFSKWTWIWGCKTVLEPIIGKRGRPLFTGKDF